MSITLSFSSIIFTLCTTIMYIFSYKLWRVLKKEEIRQKVFKKSKSEIPNTLVHYFFVTINLLAVSTLIFAFGLWFFSFNGKTLGYIKIVGDIFLYLSFAYGINIPLYLKSPKINRKVIVWILAGLSSFLIIYQIVFPPMPELINSVIYWNVGLVVSWTLYIAGLVMWLPTGIIFLFEGFKAKQEFLKYFFLSASFIIMSMFGILMLITKNAILVITSQFLLAVGCVFLFLGMFYKGALKR